MGIACVAVLASGGWIFKVVVSSCSHKNEEVVLRADRPRLIPGLSALQPISPYPLVQIEPMIGENLKRLSVPSLQNMI